MCGGGGRGGLRGGKRLNFMLDLGFEAGQNALSVG